MAKGSNVPVEQIDEFRWRIPRSCRADMRVDGLVYSSQAMIADVIAGGGFKGGQVVGVSDRRGEAVRERPVYPWDMTASIYKLMGIDPNGQLPHPHGCVAHVTPTGSGLVASGGMLTEIM